MEPRRWLRRLDPSERKDQLDRLCGGVGSSKVLAAALPGLEDPLAPFQIACDVAVQDTNLTEDVDVYQFHVLGPWWPPTPELTAPARVHPVIFEYPRVDIVAVDVTSPPGFGTKDPPAPVKLESPFGRYQWVATKTPTGYHVDRAFALVPLMVKTTDYDALKAFLKQVHAADQTSLAFQRAKDAP
jgi:hypothetical protein